MPPADYAFMKVYSYNVDQRKYDKHRFYEYEKFRYLPSLLKRLRNMDSLSDRTMRLFWELLATQGNSRPKTQLEVRNYQPPYKRAMVDFVVDTGADVSMLTAETADVLGIDRDFGEGDPLKVKGIGGIAFAGLPRWIFVFLGGKLHPIPVLVPPKDSRVSGLRSVPLQRNSLGRAAITNCFLMCFDNKRFYVFARLVSEPSKM